jgi:hypothetical protein
MVDMSELLSAIISSNISNYVKVKNVSFVLSEISSILISTVRFLMNLRVSYTSFVNIAGSPKILNAIQCIWTLLNCQDCFLFHLPILILLRTIVM